MISRSRRALALAACALPALSAHAARAAEAERPAVKVVLARENGRWIADYRFAKAAPVWLFQRSKDSIDGARWRLASFRVETPGVTLARLGNFDALYRKDHRPLRHVRIQVTPFAQPLRSDYAPALRFSDGGLAFYSHHFLVTPLASVAAAEALPGDPDWSKIEDAPATLAIRDPGHRLLLRGRIERDEIAMPLAAADTYIYSGDTPLVDTGDFAAVIDPGLPAWVRGQLDAFLPRLMQLYTARLGTPAGTRPSALVAWEGAERPGLSLGGGVMDRLVVMAISGKQMLAPAPKVLASLRWFFGHETSHFWIGQTVDYGDASEAWITEGSADLLAIRALQQIVPGYDPAPKLQEELDACLTLNGAGKPLATAASRGDYKAHYACGAMLLMVAESAAKARDSTQDAFSLIRRLIDANRSDGKVSEADWLAIFTEAAGPDAGREVQAFLDAGVPDASAFWARLFAETGVRYARDGAGLRLGGPES